jgi:hypothetical protein
MPGEIIDHNGFFVSHNQLFLSLPPGRADVARLPENF